MEKTIIIDGKSILFKSTASTPLRFKAQFGKDFFSEVIKLNKLNKAKNKNRELDVESLEGLDFEVFYNIIWTLAKTANPKIPEPITWLDGFEEFPMFEIIPEVQDLITFSIQGKKKLRGTTK